MIDHIAITGGNDRNGNAEAVGGFTLHPGDTLAVVGPTGSGKSELLADIEQIADGDTPSGRRVVFHGWSGSSPLGAVAVLSQRTNFLMDADVATFIDIHAACLGKKNGAVEDAVIGLANTLCGEPIRATDALQALSGGQTRALMIADIALISDAPVILLDELENAGIDKMKALSALSAQGKIILMATHDPVLVLLGHRRVVMRHGGMIGLHNVDGPELIWRERLCAMDAVTQQVRETLRAGQQLSSENIPCLI